MTDRADRRQDRLFVVCLVFAILAPPIGMFYLPLVPLVALAVKIHIFDATNSIAFRNDAFFVFLLILLSLIWSILSLLINNLESVEYIITLSRMIAILSVLWLTIGADRRISIRSVFQAFVIAAAINATVVFYQMVVITSGLPLPLLRLADTFYGAVPYEESVRAIGLMSGHDSSSLLSLVGFVLTYGQKEVVLLRSRASRLVVPVFFLLAMVFSGRTGLLLALFYIVAIPFLDRRMALRSSLVVGFGVGGVAFLFLAGGEYGELLVRRAFSVFISYVETGRVYDYSAADTLQSYSIPTDWRIYLFGNSLPHFHKFGARSDSGYMQWLYGNGLPVLASLLVCVAYICYLTFRRLGVHSTFLLLLMMAACIKGPYIFTKITAELFFSVLIVLSDASRRAKAVPALGARTRVDVPV